MNLSLIMHVGNKPQYNKQPVSCHQYKSDFFVLLAIGVC